MRSESPHVFPWRPSPSIIREVPVNTCSDLKWITNLK